MSTALWRQGGRKHVWIVGFAENNFYVPHLLTTQYFRDAIWMKVICTMITTESPRVYRADFLASKLITR